MRYQGSLTSIRVNLNRSVGDLAEARKLAIQTFRAVVRGRVDENSGETSTRLASIDSIGRQLLELEAPVDAMRAYSSTLERRASEDPADDWGTGTGWESITRGVELALSAVRNTDESILLNELLLEKTGDGPAVDLVAVVFPREPDRATLFSVFDDLVNRAASDLQFLAMMSARLERSAAGPTARHRSSDRLRARRTRRGPQRVPQRSSGSNGW